MAWGNVFVLGLSCLRVLYAATLEEDLLRIPLVRRHVQEEKVAQLLPSGAVASIRTNHKDGTHHKHSNKHSNKEHHGAHHKHSSKDGTPSDPSPDICDHRFQINTVKENKCLSGMDKLVDIVTPDGCKLAAKKFDLTYAGEVNNYYVNQLPYPHHCFKKATDGKVYYNPTETEPLPVAGTTELSGWKLCWEEKFPYADADNACGGGFEPIGNHERTCKDALYCKLGHNGCRIHSELEWNNGTTYDTVPGCYVNQETYSKHSGCFGYNNAATGLKPPSESTTKHLAVCKPIGWRSAF